METLPAEILIQIVKKVDWRTACTMQLVCKQWNRVISDPYVRKTIKYPDKPWKWGHISRNPAITLEFILSFYTDI